MNHREPVGAQELLRTALSLAARGWYVFPCSPGRKQPAFRVSWQELATTDPARISAWWCRTAYNIAIACGPSALVVLDLDVAGHGTGLTADGAASGAEELANLCHTCGEPYPDGTLTVRTPSGGQHLYFRAPPDVPIPNSAGRLAPLVDVRGAGGYVISNGSRTPQGRYKLTRPLTPSPLPGWIARLARPPRPAPAMPPESRQPIADVSAYGLAALHREAATVAAAVVSTRNDTLFRAARSLGQLVVGGVLHADDVRATLTPAAEATGLPRAEVTRTIDSGLRSGARMPRGRPNPPHDPELTEPVNDHPQAP